MSSNDDTPADTTPYGAPGGASQLAVAHPRNGLGTAGLVLGILALVSVVTVLFFYVGVVLAVVAIILAVLGRKRVRRHEASNRGAATAGLVLGIVSLVLGLLLLVLAVVGVAFFKDTIDKCKDVPTSQQSSCVHHSIDN